MIHRHIHRLRKEPEHKKKKAALIVSGSITFMIAMIWAVTLPTRLAQTQAAAVGSTPSLQPISESFGNEYDQLINSLNPQTNVGEVADTSYNTDSSVATTPTTNSDVIVSDPTIPSDETTIEYTFDDGYTATYSQ